METKNEQSSPLQEAAREMASVIRRHRLTYLQSVSVIRTARKLAGVAATRPAKRLPKNFTDTERESFFKAVEHGGNAQHELLFRLLYATGLRVSELTNLRRECVDVPRCEIRVNQGKGAKDRVVLFTESLQLPLRLYLEATPDNVFLFETRRKQKMTPRWVQTLTKQYGEQAGIPDAHPHRFRHSLLTDLTRAGLTDSQIQQVSGHSTKASLVVYQSLALADVADAYQEAMQSGKRR
jgi:integrase/recombinase XerD